MSEFKQIHVEDVVPGGIGLSKYSGAIYCPRFSRKTLIICPGSRDVSVTVEVSLVDQNVPPGDWVPRQTMMGGTAQAGKAFSVTIDDSVTYLRVQITAIGAPPDRCRVICNGHTIL